MPFSFFWMVLTEMSREKLVIKIGHNKVTAGVFTYIATEGLLVVDCNQFFNLCPLCRPLFLRYLWHRFNIPAICRPQLFVAQHKTSPFEILPVSQVKVAIQVLHSITTLHIAARVGTGDTTVEAPSIFQHMLGHFER
uniref:(northern house mosquito) hypothetical protein n=1 Tax=Culex pipiens TaxID=7175 RepID=A0A8D8MWJ1_CULPI